MSTTAQHISSEIDRSDQSALCLSIIKDGKGWTGAELSEETGIVIGSISRALDALRKTGDVFRDDNKRGARYFPAETEGDRKRLIYLYEKEQYGRALNKMRQSANLLISKMLPHHKAWQREIFEHLNKEV